MTDKELRKLSRLELLELLLKESEENKRLKDELKKIKNEKSIEKTTEQLKETAVQFDASLQNADALVTTLQKLVSSENVDYTEDEEKKSNYKRKISPVSNGSVDVDIYRRLMQFYSQDISNLDHLPAKLHIDVAVRLAELLKK